MQQALDDDLTGLRTRRAFMPLLGRQVVAASEMRMAMALLVIDVDGFAQVNGVHGYGIGDELLRHVADVLRKVARPQDYVARIGDDRFALVLTRMLNRGHAELAVQKLMRLFEPHFQASSVRMAVSVSVGVAMCPEHASHADHLLRRAEAALLRARRAGQRIAFAPDSAADLDISDEWDLEMQLTGAIERGELSLHYQPKVSLRDGRTVGVEALMRWNSLARGAVSPSVFIPIAERMGLMRKFTAWALNTALRQAGQWSTPDRPAEVSVNLPSTLAAQPDLPELVGNALRLWEGSGVRLMLEITEDSLMEAKRAFPVLESVRELGVQISIDDFGTGYSCLAYFRDIPANELKIDRSFVASLLTDSASVDIVRLIVDLAHRFGLTVVAEGVEDEATLAKLRELGCDFVQGYLYARPMPAADFMAWEAGRAPG